MSDDHVQHFSIFLRGCKQPNFSTFLRNEIPDQVRDDVSIKFMMTGHSHFGRQR